MRYLSVPAREAYESEVLPAHFGKAYAPHGGVTLGPRALLDRPGTELIDLGGAALAIHPDTAAWAFLTAAEADAFGGLRGVTVGELRERSPGGGVDDFAALLFRRGLITVDGQAAVDHTIFEDSPNVPDGHLVELLVTERCNLGCTYCLAGTHARMPRMTPEVARRTIDLAFAMTEAHVLAFEFSGGEPFMEFALMRELAAYIRQHPQREGRAVHLNVQTNATLLDDERVRWLRENDVRVGVSLDGRPQSHDISRPTLGGGSSYPKLMRGLELLRDHGIPFGALVVLNRSNVDSVGDLLDFLAEQGISSFKLNPVAFLGTARGNWQDVGLRQEEVVAYFSELVELVASGSAPVLEDNLRTMCEFLVSKQRSTRCLRGHCGAGDSFQAVSAAGDIYPCGRATQSPGLKLGNVLDLDTASLSAPARRSAVIAEIRARRPRTLEGCVTCPYRQLCQAGCSAQAWERYGTVRHRTPECHFYKSLYPLLMRRLSFDLDAVERMSAAGYFDGAGLVVRHEPLRAAVPA